MQTQVSIEHQKRMLRHLKGQAMHLKNQRPIFVPQDQWEEFAKLSKAALMDIVWDYAARISGSTAANAIMKEFRAERDVILTHRKQAKSA